jgi:DNA polymerase epsilon subunit 2
LIGAYLQIGRDDQLANGYRTSTKPSLLPPPTHKTEYFRQRYHIVQQRILHNESFQSSPDFASKTDANRITPIANLLGRSGSTHLLLGLLTISATGTLAISDLTGTIALDIQHAKPVGEDESAWFCPGMIVLIDGVYSEDYSTTAESALGNSGGIGGTIGGKFIASVLAHPPCERRAAALGIQESTGPGAKLAASGPGFGWTDFLGVGSERATGSRMRKLESQIIGPGAPHEGNAKIAIASEINLDNPASLAAIRTLLSTYSALDPAEFPMTLVLIGNFVSHAALAGAPGAGSIEYKEYFNALASVFSDFPQLVARLTIVFVPGDKDAWPSAFSAGAASPLPQKQVPELFTTRMKRVIGEANREVGGIAKGRKEGEVVWSSNPCRVSWFGSVGEMVVLRDDATGRLRRTALRFKSQPRGDGEEEEDAMMSGGNGTAEEPMDVDAPRFRSAPDMNAAVSTPDPDILTARRLIKTLLDQGHLSPYPLNARPVHWDFGSALQLYPLPTALVVADHEAPAFALNYMGCCVMNPGCLVDGRRGERARWVEYDVREGKGVVRIEGS